MPDPFLDRVVQYPKRFTIQADGADGTVNDPALDGKDIALTVKPGVITIPGTSLNAEELNKRIVGDFEDKTFTELRTLLDTLNIDKDQNANMIVNKILMRTHFQLLDNSDGLANYIPLDSVVIEAGKVKITVGASAFEDWQAPMISKLDNTEYTIIMSIDRVDSLVGSPVISVNGASLGIANVAIGNFNNVGIFRNSFTSGTITADGKLGMFLSGGTSGTVYARFILVLGDGTDISDAKALDLMTSEIFGKAKTVNPHLLTIGKNLLPYPSGAIFKTNGITVSIDNEGLITIDGVASAQTRINLLETIKFETSLATILALGYTLDLPKKQIAVNCATISGSKTGTGNFAAYHSLSNLQIAVDFGDSSSIYTITDIINACYLNIQSGDTYANYKMKINIVEGATVEDFTKYNSNEDNKFGFEVEGNSVTNNVETVEDTIELRNNKYYHIKRILEDGVNFQAIGGVSGNWVYDVPNAHFEIDFATLGIDPNFIQGVQSLARIIIDGKSYSNDLSFPYKFVFNDGSGLLSGNPGILFVDPDYVTTATLAAFIAAATEVVFDFYMKPEDWEENEIASTGYTIIEEDGTVIEENDEETPYEMETEIPINIPASIEEVIKDVRRLFDIKNEYVVLEDFTSDNLDIPSTGTPGIFTTDRMSEIYSKYIIVYELAHLEANQGLGYQFMEFVNPYFAEPNSVVDEDIKKKLGRIRQAAAGGDLFLDYEFTLYFLVATPNQLGIGSGASYQDQKKTAATNVYFGKVASTSIDVVALLGVKLNE